MFVRLAQRMGGVMDDEIRKLRLQHERNRNLVAAMAQTLDGYERGEERPTAALIEGVESYVSALRRHIHTEDHHFFPLVARELSLLDLASLRAEFERVDAAHGRLFFDESQEQVEEMGLMVLEI